MVRDAAGSKGFSGAAALTGPVRRGDAAAIERHLAILRARLPGAVPLFLASVEAQLPLARALLDAPAGELDAIESLVALALAAQSR